MEHIRNRTLVDLAAGMVGGPASRGAARGGGGGGPLSENLNCGDGGDGDGAGGHKPPPPPELRLERADWCEAAASISRALLQQSQELVDMTFEELRAARIDDGGVQQLLDTLLEFSTTKAHRGIPVGGPPGEVGASPLPLPNWLLIPSLVLHCYPYHPSPYPPTHTIHRPTLLPIPSIVPRNALDPIRRNRS
eukprot:366249-Chlamydomonas_euryale.AAC.12